MKAPPAFQAYARDWLGDPQVSSCCPATRGIWWDAICAMHEAGRTGTLTGTVEELARICRCGPKEMEAALADLKRSQTANVTLRNDRVTLTNRRMRREYKSRVSGKIRQKRHRQSQSRNADVTIPLQSSSFKLTTTSPTETSPERRSTSNPQAEKVARLEAIYPPAGLPMNEKKRGCPWGAQWLKAWNDDEALEMALREATEAGYGNKPATYIHQVLETARRGDGHVRPGIQSKRKEAVGTDDERRRQLAELD